VIEFNSTAGRWYREAATPLATICAMRRDWVAALEARAGTEMAHAPESALRVARQPTGCAR